MNKTSLIRFKDEINQIREYFKHIQYVDNVVNYNVSEDDGFEVRRILISLKNHNKSFKTDKKIFEYKASIISIYGLLEKYIEVWIKEYLDSLSNLVTDYTQIDEKIRSNHFDLSLKLITNITSRESAKYQHLTKEQILQKLNNCITTPTNYSFNTESFILFSGNLKHTQIVNLFKLINVNLNESLSRSKTLVKYLQEKKGISNIANIKTDTLYNTIQDLVDRRNQIAHGSEGVDNILGISELEVYTEFLENYCQSIFEVLAEELIKQESIYSFQEIKNVISIYSSKILAFEVENCAIKVGDILIIKTLEGNFRKEPIVTIQVNGESYNKIEVVEKTKIAISVNYRIKENQTFYIATQ